MGTIELPDEVLPERIFFTRLVFEHVAVVGDRVRRRGGRAWLVVVDVFPAGVDGEFIGQGLFGTVFGKRADG